jgi:hypothetical protein
LKNSTGPKEISSASRYKSHWHKEKPRLREKTGFVSSLTPRCKSRGFFIGACAVEYQEFILALPLQGGPQLAALSHPSSSTSGRSRRLAFGATRFAE